MKVFLFISPSGDAWAAAKRIKEEGTRAIVYINSEKKRRVGNGFVEKHPEQRVLIGEDGTLDEEVLKSILIPRPDCIVFDMVEAGFGKLADRLRKEGFAVIGGCSWGDKIELDRPYGATVMRAMGINIPTTTKFTDYNKAIQFVEVKNRPFVYKPSGNQCTTTTYVAKEASDLIGMLEFYSTSIKEEFELQEKVEGVEVSSEVWFNGEQVVNVNHTMEEKPLMEGGKGPKAGCMGSVVWIGSQDTKLYKEGVGKMVPALKKVGYRGPIDLNAIVTKDSLYGLEFTARFGYDALWILFDMYKGRISDLLYSVASGVAKRLEFKSLWGLGIDLCVPPYPLHIEESDLYKDILIQGITRESEKHFWMYDIYKSNNRTLCAGTCGDLGTITARGDAIDNWSPIRDAKRRVLRSINNLIVPDLMYRRDIGDRVQGDYDKLMEWGWLS